ncbi:MAG: hypothetical protein AAB036_00930 [Elusimicrobiota bacterium]
MNMIPSICAALSLALPAAADVSVHSESSTTGYAGMGAFKSKLSRRISGLKSREDGEMKFTGAIMSRLGGGGSTAHILRIDLDKRWDLDVAKKTYRESPIVLPSGSASADPRDPQHTRAEKITHRVKSAKVDVKKTGQTRQINGFAASRYQATLSLVIEEIASKKTAEFGMTSDVWTTPWTPTLKQALEEESRFQKAHLKKLGVDLTPQDRGRFGLDSARMLLSASGSEVEEALGKVSREMSKIEGYVVLTETSWHAPAPKQEKSRPVPEQEEDSALADAAGATSLGGAALGFMGGLAKKAVKQKAAAAVAREPGTPDILVRTEVKSVELKTLASDLFELPAGFKKKT